MVHLILKDKMSQMTLVPGFVGEGHILRCISKIFIILIFENLTPWLTKVAFISETGQCHYSKDVLKTHLFPQQIWFSQYISDL